MRKIFAIISLLISVGCSSVTPVSPLQLTLYSPNIGARSSVAIGQMMLSKASGEGGFGFRVDQPVFLSSFIPAVPAGSNWRAILFNEFAQAYICMNEDDPAATPREFSRNKYCIGVRKTDNVITGYAECKSGLYNSNIKTNNVKAVPVEAVISKNALRQELTYLGTQQNTVILSYREYRLTRPKEAVSWQNISYNLDKGNVLGFKDMKIEVHQTDNSSIQYTIK